MKTVAAMIFGGVLATLSGEAGAATIDTSRFGGATVLFEGDGFILLDAAGGVTTAGDLLGDLFLDSFNPADPLDSSLDFVDFAAPLSPAVDFTIMAEMIQFLFEDGGFAFLFTADAAGTGVDFTDPGGLFDVDARVRLERLAAIPLPATAPLILVALGSLAVVARRKRARGAHPDQSA